MFEYQGEITEEVEFDEGQIQPEPEQADLEILQEYAASIDEDLFSLMNQLEDLHSHFKGKSRIFLANMIKDCQKNLKEISKNIIKAQAECIDE